MLKHRKLLPFFVFILVCLVSPAQAQLPQIDTGLAYLTSAQSPEGTWDSDTSQVDTTEATVSVLESLKLLNQTNGTAYTAGTSWLQAQSPQSVDFIAERILALGLTDGNVDGLLPAFDSLHGAWGGYDGYAINTLDTALALQALQATGTSDLTTTNAALAYLTNQQNADGGWGFLPGDDSNVYITSVVSASLQKFPQITTIAAAINSASSFLLAHQNPDGGFGNAPSTVYETALAYAALVAVSDNTTALTGAANYLVGAQAADGSWDEDPYSTALALKALYFSQNKPSGPPPPPPGGTITGTLLDATTNQQLGGVAVVLESNPLIHASTAANGSFVLNNVPAGTQQVTFSLAGYKGASAATDVVADSTVNLGNITLVSSYSTGTIAGTITDSTGQPLADVAITVNGAWNGSTVTGADGSFSFTYVTPGDVTISAAKAGYQTVTITGTVFARTTLTFSPRLETTPSQITTGTLVGRVVDSYWGVPIDHLPGEQGVTVTLSGGISVAPDPDNGGRFVIQGLAPNTYQVTVGMNGYTGQTFRVVIAPGVTTDLGTIRLEMSISKMTLTGKVTDAISGSPIRDAEVSVEGTMLTGRTDFSGTYAIADINTPSQITVRAIAPGYIGRTFIVGSEPWTQTMDIALTPQQTTGGLTGTVVDAVSKLPLAGVSLTLASDPSISATTDSTGTFSFASIPKGPQQVTLALDGYPQRILTTSIVAGITNNVGVVSLSVDQLPASVQGVVSDAIAGKPFSGVDMQANGSGSWQTVTATDGSYRMDDVTPGTVTVVATPLAHPGYYEASFTGTLAPGGILVFSPALSTLPPSTVAVSVRTDKEEYAKSDTVGLSVNLQNTEGTDFASSLHVKVTDPAGTVVFDRNLDLNLAADAEFAQNLSFGLPLSSPGGTYKAQAELFDTNGMLLGVGTKDFGVATSQITVTPTLPTALTTGANTITFNLTNAGHLAVAIGVLAVTLKDPDGQTISTASQDFSLGVGASATLPLTLSIPDLKFGTYTLSYTESDETLAGTPTELPIPNTLTITPLFDSNSHRIRQTAGLEVTLKNTGRFNLDPTGTGLPVTVSVPDAGYKETKTLVPVPAVGATTGSDLLYSFVLPETLTAGLHKATVTITLPSGSTQVQSAQLAIAESSLALSPIPAKFSAGEMISPVITNSGGVDTSVQYKLSLFDVKSALVAEATGTETALAGSAPQLNLTIPSGAADGNYNLVVTYQNLRTGKEEIVPNPIAISGVKGALQVQTDKQNYLTTENITALSNIANNGTPLQKGNLHLQVTTAAGNQKQKTWSSQYDFQQGIRDGVDTYGVNDWIIPNDDFDGASIDITKWDIYGDVSLTSGKLLLNSPGKTAQIFSKWQFDGDFDIQVDFSNNNSLSYQGAEIGVHIGNYKILIKNDKIEGYFSGIHRLSDGVFLASKTAGGSTFVSSGSLRIVRTGTTLTTYYKQGTSWVKFFSYTKPDLTPYGIATILEWAGPGYSTSAEFDNFRVNSGRIKTENQTVGSVRLLPFNDNFDDGVVSPDRWKINDFIDAGVPANDGLITEENGKRVINVINGKYFETVETASNFELLNNFDIQVNWSDFSTTIGGEGTGLELGIGSGWDNYSFIKRCIVGSTPQYLRGIKINGISNYASSNTSDTSGRLRITRVGSILRTYYWGGSGWVELGNEVTFGEQPVRMTTKTWMGGDGNASGKFDNWTVVGKRFSSTGTIRLKQDAGITTTWQNLSWNSTEPVGTSIKFRTRTANSEADLATAVWSDYLTASGSPISSPPGRWIEVEATLATADTNVTPLLNDVTVTYGNNPGDVIWQTDTPVDLAQGESADLNNLIGPIGRSGKYYLQGTLTSSTGQTVASAEYPFYVEQGDIQGTLASDKKTYRPGETVTISGEIKNLSSVDASGLVLTIQGSDPNSNPLYSETFDLPVGGSHPFSFTSTAGNDGIYGLNGTVTQNGTSLWAISDQYEVASPMVTATLSAPDTAGIEPFPLSLTLNNSGKVQATTTVRVVDDSGSVVDDQTIEIPPGESRLMQYSLQILGTTTYMAQFSGDFNQTLEKKVIYNPPPLEKSVSAKITTDKTSYNPNEQVTLVSTATANATMENLSARVTVTNSQGQGLYSETSAIPTLVQGQTVTINNQWDTKTNPAGTYLASVQILNSAGVVIANSSCNFIVNATTSPSVLLKGQLTLDKQSILTGEPVTVSYSITNAGNIDLSNIAITVQTVDMTDQTIYNTISDQANLTMGATFTNGGSIDTQNYSAKDYVVVLSASLNGSEETLANTFFRVEGAPTAPALLEPGNGTDVETFTPTLGVSNAADPNHENLTYEFEIYSDSGLTNFVSGGTVPETASITRWTVPAPLTENQTYYWRSRAYDGQLYGPWMTPASFRVNTIDDPPSAPIVSSPKEGTDVGVLAPTLTVTNASDPDSVDLTYNFTLALDPDFTQVVASTVGVPGGQEVTSWKVPINLQENSWYYWRAQADDWLMEGPWSTTASFQVNTANDPPTAPTVISPANDSVLAALSTEVVVNNSVDPDSPVLSYYFEADTQPTFDSADLIRSDAVIEGQDTTTWNLTGLKDNTRYYVRVKASDGLAESPWSNTVDFFANTVNDPPTVPTLDNPSNGTGVKVFSPTLSVHNSTDLDGDQLTYEFEVYADAAMTDLVTQSGSVAEMPNVTSWTVPISLTENQTYYWRARSFDGKLYSAWMPTAAFMVNTANDAPGAPALSAPEDGSSLETLNPTLTVVNAVDPDSDQLTYDFEVYSNNVLIDTMSGVTEGADGTTSITLGHPLSDNTSYSWRARAFDGDRYGQWMDMATFTIHIPQAAIKAEIKFEPVTLNKKSNGTWVKVDILLPAGHNAEDVDISSIRLEGVVPAEAWPYSISHAEGGDKLTVKFSRSDVISVLPEGEQVPVHITGEAGSTPFEGAAIIRVIDK